MKIFRLSHLLLCSTLLLGALSSHAEPMLNGMAVSSELGKERFIAAIYTESLSKDANALLSSGGERRMELKVTADRFSARSLNSMWIEGMAINNPGAALEREADNMAKLNNMVRKSLTAGDVLSIVTAPGAGVTITLNGTELGTINSDEFFSMLLRTWIGPVPLSTDFKEGLLAAGEVDASLAARYASIEPSPSRISAIAAWASPAESEEQQVAAASTDNAIAPPPLQVSITPPPVETSRPAAPARSASGNQSGAGSSASSTAANNTASSNSGAPSNASAANNAASASQGSASQSSASQNRGSQSNASQSNVSQSNAAPGRASASSESAADAEPTPTRVQTIDVARADVPARPVSPPVQDDEEEEEEMVVSGASILARQLYVTEVIRKANRVLEYPRRALQRNQQGSVRVAVTVDREGQVINVTTLEESKHNLLNKEALDLISRAAPYPPLPDALRGPSLTFTVPVIFVLTTN